MSRVIQRRPKGVALLTILLVVAIATVLGVAMAREQHNNIRYSRNHFDLLQAKQYALGGEELARQMLWQDFADGALKDDLQEAWANPALYFEFENGEVSLQIEDLQSRINVNSLARQDNIGVAARTRLNAMVALLSIDPAVVARMQDWIDADGSALPLGAEDYDYLGLERPYRSSGQYMVNSTEVRLLIGMDAEIYAALAPFITALPDDSVAVNLNTASPTVLQSLVGGGNNQVESFIADRETQGGFDSLPAALSSLGVPGGTAPAGVGVQSAFFEVRVRARFSDRFAYLTSIIQRDPTTGSLLVIYRDTGRKILPPPIND